MSAIGLIIDTLARGANIPRTIIIEHLVDMAIEADLHKTQVPQRYAIPPGEALPSPLDAAAMFKYIRDFRGLLYRHRLIINRRDYGVPDRMDALICYKHLLIENLVIESKNMVIKPGVKHGKKSAPSIIEALKNDSE